MNVPVYITQMRYVGILLHNIVYYRSQRGNLHGAGALLTYLQALSEDSQLPEILRSIYTNVRHKLLANQYFEYDFTGEVSDVSACFH